MRESAAGPCCDLLLPEPGNAIKGAMRGPRSELQAATAYSGDPAAFDDLMRVCSSAELHLVSPADRGDVEPGSSSGGELTDAKQHFQLTHDYLIGALREWLTRRQRETPKGRGHCCWLSGRRFGWHGRETAISRARRVGYDPLACVPIHDRSGTAGDAGRADRRYATRALAALVAIGLATIVFWQVRGVVTANHLQEKLLNTSMERVPGIVEEMGPYRRWIDSKLRLALRRSAANSQQSLKLGLALLPAEPHRVDELFERLLVSDPQECRTICSAIVPHAERIRPALSIAVDATNPDPKRRLRAACCLAQLDANDPRWPALGTFVVDRLMAEEPLSLGYSRDALRPVYAHLFEPMVDRLDRDDLEDSQRRVLVDLYRAYSNDLPDSDIPIRRRLGRRAVEISTVHPAIIARRRANLAAVLVAIDRGDEVWPNLVHSKNPTYRYQLIERFGPSGVEAVQSGTAVRRGKRCFGACVP